MNGPVVVGVDGSAESDRALAWAGQAAVANDATLVIVTCVDLSAVNQDDRDKTVAEGQELLVEAMATAFEADVDKVDTELATGDPSLALLKAGDGALMMVLGTHGRGRLPSALLGSIAYRVGGRASCPVVLVGEHHLAPADRALADVAVGLSRQGRGEAALGFALDQAAHWGGRLIAIHATGDGAGQAAAHETQRVALTELLERAAELHPEVEVGLRVIEADAMTTLAEWTARVSLLVLGRGSGSGGGSSERRIGSLVPSLLREAPCPIAIVGNGRQ